MNGRQTLLGNKELGLRIKALRRKAGLSQSALGEEVGVSYQQIQKYENGTSVISVERLQQIAGVLSVSPAFFFFRSPKVVKKGPDRQAAEPSIAKVKAFRIAREEMTVLKQLRSIKNRKIKKAVLAHIKAIGSAEKK